MTTTTNEIRKYIVMTHGQECECPWCGCPVDHGSVAYETESEAGYCCKACAAAALKAEREEA